MEKADDLIKNTFSGWEKCPVCSKKFKSINYLDMHVKNKHPVLLKHWNKLRGIDNGTEEETTKIKKDKSDNDIKEILNRINEIQNNN